MKRITILSLVLALALIFSRPLQATSINYYIGADLVKAAPNTGDPLGLGNSSVSLKAKFTLTPPPFSL